MSPIDPLSVVKATAAVGEVVASVGGTPEGERAKIEFGKAALTLAKAVNVALLPIAAINFGYDKARTYFQERFQQDLAAKAASIPADRIVEPKASLAGPALQGLAFSHDEEALRDMYLELLASAMDGRVPNQAHPAFVEIVRQLDAVEAHYLKSFLGTEGSIPVVEYRLRHAGRITSSSIISWFTLLGPVAPLHSLDEERTPTEEPRFPAMAVNWQRLGLVTVEYGKQLFSGDRYEWAKTRPEMVRLRAEQGEHADKVYYETGSMTPTPWGKQFASAVGIPSIPLAHDGSE